MEVLAHHMLQPILNSINNGIKKEEALLTLKKLFLIECRYNLKIIAILKWKNSSEGFKKEVIKSMKAESAKALFGYADKSKIKYLMEFVKVKSNSKIQNEIKIVSIISKIEILKTLSQLNNSLQKDNKAIYKMRINNLEKLLLEIVEKLERELNN